MLGISEIIGYFSLFMVVLGIASYFIAPLGRVMIKFLQAWFGHFSKEEIQKFIILGITFAFVIGIYWTLRPMKDAIFMSMVGKHNIPWAKLVSLCVLFPMVIVYSKLVDKFHRHKMLYVMAFMYAVATLAFGLLLWHPEYGLPNKVVADNRILGWAWYVFVESYGSLMVALFWAFATDITSPDSAKRGFSIVVMLGQMGAILGPLLITPLAGPTRWGSSAPVVMVCGGLIFLIILFVKIFMTVTPKSQLVGYSGVKAAKAESEPGFLEGLYLLLSNWYLLGIFAIITIYEIIVTIIDFKFKSLVCDVCLDESARTLYLGDYAVWVNVISFACLMLGVSNIQRRLGLRFSLALMPFIIGGAIATFYVSPVVSVVFWIMVGAKAFNYALNGPAMKQLYVPTSEEVKYKSQAWIETFGSRSSKAAGSGINLLQTPFVNWFGAAGVGLHIAVCTYFSFGLLAAWFFVALYLGKTYDKAIKDDKVVC
ncbi:MAG: Npt1/Npt2 family nucleotide transporter [Candidatus Babeliales bacterium]|nr:Npt1/Npt2 family nucleotide transporter [Candidatus Babeliales bacterium]